MKRWAATHLWPHQLEVVNQIELEPSCFHLPRLPPGSFCRRQHFGLVHIRCMPHYLVHLYHFAYGDFQLFDIFRVKRPVVDKGGLFDLWRLVLQHPKFNSDRGVGRYKGEATTLAHSTI